MKRNKSEEIRKHLFRTGRITSLQAFTLYGVTRLASLVHKWRSKGHKITTEIAYENGVSYAIYRYQRPLAPPDPLDPPTPPHTQTYMPVMI